LRSTESLNASVSRQRHLKSKQNLLYQGIIPRYWIGPNLARRRALQLEGIKFPFRWRTWKRYSARSYLSNGEPMNGSQGYFSFKEAGTIG